MKRSVGIFIERGVASDGWARAAEDVLSAGFDGVELTLGPLPEADGDACAGASDKKLTALARLDGGVVAVAIRCATTDVEAAMARVNAVLGAAGSAKARSLNVMIPPVGSGGFAGYQDALNFACGLMREGRYAAEVGGVPLAVEVACGGCLLSPVELREIVDKANSWAVGACVEVGRVCEVGDLGDWLDTLRARVHCVRMACVDGVWPVAPEALRLCLDDVGFGGPVVLGGSGPAVADARRQLTG